MSVDLAGPRLLHHRRPPALLNRATLAMLRSPLHRLLGRALCELDYRGRRSGRAIALPVLYASWGNRVVVLVGDAPDKQWWRNFTQPTAVGIRRGWQVRAGIGRLVSPDDPAYLPARAAYIRRHHIEPQPTDRMVVIETTP
jgi:hypothetical protein